MLKALHQDSQWICLTHASSDIDIPEIAELLAAINNFDQTLKDDRRSLVKKGQLFGKTIVAKQPRDKNRRHWSRLLSLVLNAEARKTFLTLCEFNNKGIESLVPICVLEKRAWGCVVDSWLLYDYREGRQSDVTMLEQVVEQLKKLHSFGYRHGDPNFGNFMIDQDGHFFLIDCKGRSKAGHYGECYDFMLLSDRNEGVSEEDVQQLVTYNHLSLGYWLARLYRAYIQGRSSLKKVLGRRRSKNQ